MRAAREDIELMAPAGSYESLRAAIQGGADAVYFGIEKLNLRARSSNNFTLEDMDRITGIASRAGIRTYLALNSVIYDNEIGLVRKILAASREAGVSAVIASDQSVIRMARDEKIEVHLSTQLNITNTGSVKFYSAYADVVVLARELTLEQIAGIAEQIRQQDIRGPSGKQIRLELFVHGALCMAISGKCYLSLHQYGHSANRGDCLQACRRTYIVSEKETGKSLEIDREHIMSPKDLCTITFLDRILDAGVRVLKIEGRARSPEYVKTVTGCYAEAIGRYCEGSFSPEHAKRLEEKLRTVFNRGFWDGHYLGNELGEWTETYGSQATRRKIYIGKGMNYFSRPSVGEFLIETGSLEPGDEVLVTGPTTGVMEFSVGEIRVEGEKADSACKGDLISLPVPGTVRRSDKLYKMVDPGRVKLQ